MFFELENTTKENIDKLLEFARQKHLKLSPLDDLRKPRIADWSSSKKINSHDLYFITIMAIRKYEESSTF